MYPREKLRESMRLYAVTDTTWLTGRTLAGCVEDAIAGGATFVQLRDKHASSEELIVQAHTLLPLCRHAGVPFVINDDVEAAFRVGADGIHVGQGDMACVNARSLLGPDAIVGVSVQTLDEALEAQNAGADYLGVGALFGTLTKPDAVVVSFDELAAICKAVSIPVVAIGGLDEVTIPSLAATDVDGVAVVSAIFAADDIVASTRRLRTLVDGVMGGSEPYGGM